MLKNVTKSVQLSRGICSVRDTYVKTWLLVTITN